MKNPARPVATRPRPAAPGAGAFTTGIVDLYHQNAADFARARADHILAVIHKSSQSAHLVDSEYAPRRPAARGAGLLWGAYHFGTGDDVSAAGGAFPRPRRSWRRRPARARLRAEPARPHDDAPPGVRVH